MNFLGDFPEDFATVTCMFTTHQADGAPVAPLTAFEAADVLIYKNGNAAQKTSTNGVTMTSPFDSVTGLHCVVIDTSNDTGDAGFWVAGAQYTLVLSPDTETVDGIAVAKVLGSFTLGLVPLVATVAAIKAKTDNLPSDPADASDIATRFTTLDTAVDALPTNAELATALGTADDAVLAQIALVKAKTDGLTFTVAGVVDTNLQYVNDVLITGNGQAGTEWGP